MNKLTELKLWFTAFFGGLTACLGTLAVPVLTLVGLNIVDYGTGIVAAPCRNEPISSYKGFRGIAKKVCMWLLVGIGWVIDLVLSLSGISLPIKCAVASAVAIWLIANELLSILENMTDIGVPMPGFLKTIAKYIKATTEEKVDVKDGGRNEDN